MLLLTSTKTAENLGFKAIGTSSAAISSLLGYQDGECMKFGELIYFVKRIISNTSLPLTVDLESGTSYEFKYVVDGVYVNDDAADAYAWNDFAGAENSVINL